MRRYYAVMLALLILLTGCTAISGGGDEEDRVTTTPNDGLTVQFQPVKSTFQENEVLQFQVSVSNTGDATAKNIETLLFGNPFFQGRCQAIHEDEAGEGQEAVFKREMGTGERRSVDNWRCEAPLKETGGTTLVDMSSGSTDQFDAGLQVEYGYETGAETSVTIATPSKITGGGSVTTANDAGPVHAQVNLKSPRSEPDNQKMEVPIDIRNVGDGEVEGPVDVWVYKRGDKPDFDSASPDEEVHLVEGSRQIVETISGITLEQENTDARAEEKTYTIQIHMEYTYKERVSNPFTVQGQPDNVHVEEIDDAVLPGPVEPEEPDDEEEPEDIPFGEEPEIGGGTVFVVDLLEGETDDFEHSVTVEKWWRVVETEEGGEKNQSVTKVTAGDSDRCGNEAPQVRVDAGIEWDEKPWLWGGTLTVPVEEGGVSLREVSCPDQPAVECLPVDGTVEPDSMGFGNPETFTTTCFQGPLSYEANVYSDGSVISSTVSAAGTTTNAGPNRESVFELGGADSQYDVGNTVPFTVSGVEDCEERDMDVVVGSGGKTASMTCD